MAISFVSSVVSSIEQIQEMELSNEEITEVDNICLHNCDRVCENQSYLHVKFDLILSFSN